MGEMLIGRTLVLYALVVLTWLVLAHVVPRIEPPARTAKSLIVAGMMAFGVFVASAALWFEAVEINVLHENPKVTNLAELKSQWERPWGERARGLFVAGRLKPPAEGTEPQELAYYTVSRAQVKRSYFPPYLEVVLENGEEIEVACVQSPAQAVNWPQTRNGRVGLENGTPVVVWGDPSLSKGVSDGKEYYGVLGTRAIIHGDLKGLEASFLTPAKKAARPVGWMAFSVLLLSWLPFLLAFLISRRPVKAAEATLVE